MDSGIDELADLRWREVEFFSDGIEDDSEAGCQVFKLIISI
jgi:hypothetical protein